MTTIRAATVQDRPFLARMLAVAADWRPGSAVRPVEEVLADPHLARYVDAWPRPGEFGVVAFDDHGSPTGAAWCRSWSTDAAGYGFVATDVPEVSIGVVAAARGGGIGRRLLERLIDDARDRGVLRMSLSVERDNGALRLYSRLGFVAMDTPDGEDGAVTMVLDLDRGLDFDGPPVR